MASRRAGRRAMALLAASVSWTLVLPGLGGVGYAQTVGQPAVGGEYASIAQTSERIWSDAARGGEDAGELALNTLRDLPEEHASPGLARFLATSESLRAAIDKREEARAKKTEEVGAELDKFLAEDAPASLSKALRSANGLYMLATDKQALVQEQRIQDLIRRAAAAARDAEANGDWLVANELFFRLNLLLEEQGTYKQDAERVGTRLTMIRLYTPERFWELRNNQRLAEGEKPLPPYNALGEDYGKKLEGLDSDLVLRALNVSVRSHVERERAQMKSLLLGGLDAVRTLATTDDLEVTFPGLANPAARTHFLDAIDRERSALENAVARPTIHDAERLLNNVLAENARSVAVPEPALLHEFGNGAMSRLDDYSAIIWPDEVARFERMTQGKFNGVGISIQFDEETQYVKVMAPLDGSPAQRAGIRRGDLIKKIDGQSAIGISINQAVELITGPAGTGVRLTIEREGADLDFDLTRTEIPLVSIKGWRRTGPRDDQWDWFIDPENKIGYVRLQQFTDDTTKDLKAALASMKADGLKGLILDLRFNPGGQLSQAVSVANAFIDRGVIVSTEGQAVQPQTERANAFGVQLRDVPMVVLINDGSASASEIVAGAIKHYADLGGRAGAGREGALDARLVGQRTFGKGSVQNVWQIPASEALMKLTTQYYKLPDNSIIHRREGAKAWGVIPHVEVDMLPEQILEAYTMRERADTLTDEPPAALKEGEEPIPDPDKLLTDGIDLQLQYGLWLLQAKAVAQGVQHARAE